ncbi:MAG: hypothetical protein RLZZ01_1772 [Actinomycetota bacterium]
MVEPRRRLIFSTNPGRSGSGFLAELLDRSDDIDAGHERLPTMTGPWLRRVEHLGAEESRHRRRFKVEAIAHELGRLPPGVAYCDTSHMFAKTFADVVLDGFPATSITVIELRRDPVSTARSYFELGAVSSVDGTWHDWMVNPLAPAARFRVDPTTVESPFDLVFASLVDAHARAVDLRRGHPRISWIEADLADISTAAGAARLFDRLDARPPADLGSRDLDVHNTKPIEKSRLGRIVSRRLVAERYEDFLRRHGHETEVAAFARAHRGTP